MSDPIRVRFPCPHGILFRHMIRPVGPKPKWCEGGQTKLLRRPDWYGDRPGMAATEPLSVWVEVEET